MHRFGWFIHGDDSERWEGKWRMLANSIWKIYDRVDIYIHWPFLREKNLFLCPNEFIFIWKTPLMEILGKMCNFEWAREFNGKLRALFELNWQLDCRLQSVWPSFELFGGFLVGILNKLIYITFNIYLCGFCTKINKNRFKIKFRPKSTQFYFPNAKVNNNHNCTNSQSSSFPHESHPPSV